MGATLAGPSLAAAATPSLDLAVVPTTAKVGETATGHATLSGGDSATGTIDFRAFGPDDATCEGTPAFTDTVSVSADGGYESGGFSPTTQGTYRWTAAYSGDGQNDPVATSCDDAASTTVGSASPVLRTTALGPSPTGCSVPPSSGPVVQGPRSQPFVSITFDEHLGANTEAAIDSFDAYGMAGTFFTLGREAQDQPSLIQDLLAHGNEVGNHSWNHADLTATPDKGFEQFRRANRAIEDASGFRPCLERPPHGRSDEGVVASAQRLGLTYVRWSFGQSPCWCEVDPERVAQNVLDGIRGGDIIYMHQTDADVEALPLILQGLRDQGLESVSVTRLLGGSYVGATVGRPIADSARLDSAYNPSGTVDFTAYGPEDPDCSGAPAFESGPVPVSARGRTESPPFTPPHAGEYRWGVTYSGDANNDPASSPCGADGETSTVSRVSSSVSGTATRATVGGSITDTVHLEAGQSPTGEIAFTAYGPQDPTCSGSPAFADTVAVSGNGDYDSGDYTPPTAGAYRWVVAYSGDGDNEGASTTCGGARQSSFVAKATPALDQLSAPQSVLGDGIHTTARLAGGRSPGGTIRFRLYGRGDADCTDRPVFSTTTPVAGNGAYASPDFVPARPGTYRWTARYSGDVSNKPVTSPCDSPGHAVSVSR